jgi:HAD domain in Swiss Army Knife RNA repair proteins
MSKILFLDIDGVLLPGRAYMLPNQTNNPYVTVFDPCAVSMLNKACEKQGRQIVVHSSWVKHWSKDEIFNHLQEQEVNTSLFHEDWYTDPQFHWRYDRVRDWMSRHKEVTDWVVVDDELAKSEEDMRFLNGHAIFTDFDEGITLKNFRQLLDGTFPVKT